jgi:hypothetical protein
VRTTLTLEADVARLLDEEVHRARKPLKAVVNEALRRGLTRGGPSRRRPRYRVEVHAAQLRSGFDRGTLNSLADELEDAAILTRLGPSSRA